MLASNRTMGYFQLLNDGKEVATGKQMSLEVCPAVEQCLLNISWTRDSALAMSRNYFDFVKRQFRDGNGNYQLKTLRTNIVTVPIEMLLSKGSPLLPRINDILLKIMESGLIQYWTELIASRQTALEAKTSHRTEKVLTMDNLQGAFLMWFIGIGLSILGFVGELLFNRFGGN